MDDRVVLALACFGTVVVTALLTVLLVHRRARRQARDKAVLEQLSPLIEQHEEAQQQYASLLEEERRKNVALAEENRVLQEKAEDLRRRLKSSERLPQRKGTTVRFFYQPVLVLGPRGVGKTSLIRQWDVPWDFRDVEASRGHRQCDVLVQELRVSGNHRKGPPDQALPDRVLLGLRLHDFPGELEAQQLVLDAVRKETLRLRKASQLNLGVVLICMLAADEAANHPSPATKEYYGGHLFRQLRGLYEGREIDIPRVIVVYNKTDRLRGHLPPGTPNAELLDRCRSTFAATCESLLAIVHTKHLHPVLTVLSRDGAALGSEGANTVKGLAIQPMVEAFGGATGDGDTPGDWDV